MAPGASVSRQYDVNANQVFSWRRRHCAADQPPAPALSTPGLVPMTITPGPDDEGASPPAPTLSETIEIEVAGDYRVRIGSGFDGRALKRVLEVLSARCAST